MSNVFLGVKIIIIIINSTFILYNKVLYKINDNSFAYWFNN